MLRKLAILTLMALAMPVLGGRPPLLEPVRDINAQPGAPVGLHVPTGARGGAAGDKFYFPMQSPATGIELWKTDGTAAGTAPAPETDAGSPSPFSFNSVVTMGGDLFFVAENAAMGNEVHVLRGESGRVEVLKDVTPGGAHTLRVLMAATEDQLFYRHEPDDFTTELWVSDGTGTGTRLVRMFDLYDTERSGEEKRIVPPGNYIREMHPGDELLYFYMARYYGPGAIWATDGTASGTRTVVENLDSGLFFRTNQITVMGDDGFYFLTENGEAVLYHSSNGGPGERLMQPTFEGEPIYYLDIVETGDTVFYFADASNPTDRRVWRSDGTTSGTVPIAGQGVRGDGGRYPTAIIGDTLYYIGSEAGFPLVRVTPDAEEAEVLLSVGLDSLDEVIRGIEAIDNRWLALISGVSRGGENMHVYDTLTDEFHRVFDPYQGYDYWVDYLGTRGSDIYYTVSKSTPPYYAGAVRRPMEVWRLSAPDRSLELLHTNEGNTQDSAPFHLFPFQDALYFWANDGVNGRQVWKSEGTGESTRPFAVVQDPTIDVYIPGFVSTSERFFFTGRIAPFESTIWSSDGTTSGTIYLTGAPGSIETGIMEALGVIEDQAYFIRYADGERGPAILRSDGTTSGTVKLVMPEIAEGESVGAVAGSSVLGDALHFSAYRWPASGTEPRLRFYRASNGSDLVETLESEVPLLPNESINEFHGFGNRIYFLAQSYPGGPYSTVAKYSLYYYQPDTDSHEIVARNLEGSYNTVRIFPSEEHLLVAVSTSETGLELWTVDESTDELRLVADLNPGQGSSSPHDFHALNGFTYFGATDGVGAAQLWRTDGTTSGTVALTHLPPGSVVGEIVSAEGDLYFAANDTVNGLELWRYDGQRADMVAQLVAGSPGGPTLDLAVAGGILYISGTNTDGVGIDAGHELFAVPLAELETVGARFCDLGWILH